MLVSNRKWQKRYYMTLEVRPEKMTKLPPCWLEARSCHAVRKPKPACVERPGGNTLRLREETDVQTSAPLPSSSHV